MAHKPPLSISRRRFLHVSAAAAGGLVMAGCSGDESKGSDGDVDVAIIGGGIAGLMTARELVRGGVDQVRVFEARDRVGGRTLNQNVGAAVAEAGGQWVGPGQTEILALIEELGLGTFATFDSGDAVVMFGGFRLTGRGDFLEDNERRDLDQAVAALDAMAEQVPLAAPWSAARASEWDAMSVATWLDSAVTTEGARFDIEAAIGSTLAAPASAVSLLYFLFLLHGAGGYRRLQDIEGGAQERRIVGGAQLVSLRLAEELGSRVRLRSAVQSIRDVGERVEIVLADQSVVRARRVVVAMMPSDAGRIAFEPTLPAERVGLVEGWRGGDGFKAHLVYDTPFWRTDGLSGQSFTDGVVEVTFDNSPASGSPGVLLVFADAARLPGDREARRDALAEALVPLFGARARSPIGYADMDWSQEAFTSGCVSPVPPRLLTRFGTALRAPVGRVHWAGTETSEVWNGYMEGAVRSGQRAAAEVLALL